MHPPFALPFEQVVPEGRITVLGYYLPAGTYVSRSPYVINKHKGTFGGDTEFWRPERWLERDGKYKIKLIDSVLTVSRRFSITSSRVFLCRLKSACTRVVLTYSLQFGAGRRICLGKHIGILEIRKLISFLVLNYNVRFSAQPFENIKLTTSRCIS
jgi:cytochrome P450